MQTTENITALGNVAGISEKAPHGYGRCPSCNHVNVHLDESGFLKAHHATLRDSVRCEGSGKFPYRVGVRRDDGRCSGCGASGFNYATIGTVRGYVCMSCATIKPERE